MNGKIINNPTKIKNIKLKLDVGCEQIRLKCSETLLNGKGLTGHPEALKALIGLKVKIFITFIKT